MGKVVRCPSASAPSHSASLAETLLCHFPQQHLSPSPRGDGHAAAVPRGAGEQPLARGLLLAPWHHPWGQAWGQAALLPALPSFLNKLWISEPGLGFAQRKASPGRTWLSLPPTASGRRSTHTGQAINNRSILGRLRLRGAAHLQIIRTERPAAQRARPPNSPCADALAARDAPAPSRALRPLEQSSDANPLQQKPSYTFLGELCTLAPCLGPGNRSPLPGRPGSSITYKFTRRLQQPRAWALYQVHSTWLPGHLLPSYFISSYFLFFTFFFNNVCTISLSITRELIKP